MTDVAPEQPKPKRVIGRPFRKGVSGNPGGRKKANKTVTQLAKEAAPDAIQTLIDVMRDKSATPGVRTAAADKILDRALGKPPQIAAVASIGAAKLSELTDEQLLAILAGDDSETPMIDVTPSA